MLLAACSPSSKLRKDQTFFKKYKVDVHSAQSDHRVSKEDLEALVRQKPNRQILYIRLNLIVHNIFAPGDWDKYNGKRTARRKIKNAKRIERGKEPKDTLVKTTRHWLAYTVGEPAVVLDSVRVIKSAEQMSIYLKKKGFFKNVVYLEVAYRHGKTKKANVIYHVYPWDAYRLRNIQYQTTDTLLEERMNYFRANSSLKPDMVFDLDKLDEEREVITAYLNNRGYYEFTKEYITYDVDSTIGQNLCDITLRIRGVTRESLLPTDTVLITPHRKYFIGNINVHTRFKLLDSDYEPGDTARFGDIAILGNSNLTISDKLILCTLNMDPGDLYTKDRIDQTYKRFTQLKVFRSVGIQLLPRPGIPASQPQVLDCNILLTPAPKASVSIDPRLIHRDENLGVYGNVNFRHRNALGGAETFGVQGTAGFESTRILTESVDATTGEQISEIVRPNTFEFGGEVSVKVPRFIPFDCDRFSKSTEPFTTFSTSINHQSRPEFERTLSQFRVSYNWVENATKVSRLYVNLAEFSIIKINKTPEFQAYLDQIEDEFLSNAYNNHLISASGFGWVLNTQKQERQKYYLFNKSGIETAGFLLRKGYELSGAEVGESGGYELAKIRFAQYVKFEQDFRFYLNLQTKNKLATRLNGGVGKPYQNLDALPFEKSFFAGGSNGIRAWRARSLGPGSYRDSTSLQTFNAIGEMKIEMSMEYRFDLSNTFEGAVFLDAGNVWMLRNDANKPGSKFETNRFISEMAVGTGLGLRLDFDFFLIRFDFGLQLKDPAKIPGERWFYEPKTEYNQFLSRFDTDIKTHSYGFPPLIFNLGIGYPF